MEEKDTEGTVLSKNKPVVTMLTEALARDFAPGYLFTDDAKLAKDVEAWLLGLGDQMENESDRAYAKIVTHMIRQNKGWVVLLTNRVKKLLS